MCAGGRGRRRRLRKDPPADGPAEPGYAFVVSSLGTAEVVIPLPNDPALVGQSFHHQMVPFEVDLSFAFTAITSTNALTMTIGSF